MDEMDKENSMKLMKYGCSFPESSNSKSKELVVLSGLRNGATPSRSNNLRLRNESKFLCKKKNFLPIFAPDHPYQTSEYCAVNSNCKNNVSVFTQRIMSAKLLGVKSLQNKLSETQIRLQELINENRILNVLLKRQERALNKYEGEEAQLPQLIKTHSDEIRILQTKYKQLKAKHNDLELRLKARDNELNCLREQHKHLLLLSKDKHLGEREKLRHQVEELHETVSIQENKIKMLMRKVELESKNYKHQLSVEIGRHKETQKQLTQALFSIQKLESALEMKQKYVATGIISSRMHRLSSGYINESLPTLSKQGLSNNTAHARKDNLSGKSVEPNQTAEKNSSSANLNMSSASTVNFKDDESDLSLKAPNHSKTTTETNYSYQTDRKCSNDSQKNKTGNFDPNDSYALETMKSCNATTSTNEIIENSGVSPSIFSKDDSDMLPQYGISKSSEEIAGKKFVSLVRQQSIKDDESTLSKSRLNYESSTDKTSEPISKLFSFDRRNNDLDSNSNSDDPGEQLSWEEIKKQVYEEHKLSKERLESFSKNDFSMNMIDFGISNELDNDKKDALLKALNEIDEEKSRFDPDLNSDSDQSNHKESNYDENTSGFFRDHKTFETNLDRRYPSANNTIKINSKSGVSMKDKNKNGLMSSWYFNQYGYDVSSKSEVGDINNKSYLVRAHTQKDSDSSS